MSDSDTPSESANTEHPESRGDIFDFVLRLWRSKLLIIGCSLLGGIAAASWALLKDPIYRADVVLAPSANSTQSGGLAALAGQLEGLSSLMGLNLGGRSPAEALGVLRSRALVERFVKDNHLLPALFASRWNARAKRWKGDAPTLGDAYELFDRQIRSVREDRRTGLVTLRLEWTDRFAVADWANGLVALVNRTIRDREVSESNERIKFLNQQLEAAASIELEQAIYRVVEAEVKSRMLASVREDYAFRVVDPAVASDPDKRVRPARTMMTLAGTVFGALFAVLFLVVRDLFRLRRYPVSAHATRS